VCLLRIRQTGNCARPSSKIVCESLPAGAIRSQLLKSPVQNPYLKQKFENRLLRPTINFPGACSDGRNPQLPFQRRRIIAKKGDIARFVEFAASQIQDRLRRVLLQRAWKVCGTFARGIVERKADLYRRYLPGQLALVRRLLAAGARDRSFRSVLEDRCGPALLS